MDETTIEDITGVEVQTDAPTQIRMLFDTINYSEGQILTEDDLVDEKTSLDSIVRSRQAEYV